MEIKKEYMQKYLYNVAVEQIADEYKSKGYQISKEEPLGDYYADLIARKNDETIVIEIKSGKISPQKITQISKIGGIAKKNKYKFIVVFANPPQKKKLEVSNIEELLENYMLNDLPDELDQLSTHTSINEVSDVAIDEITIRQDGLIFVKGSGLINVNIQYGSDTDQDNDSGHATNDNFSFDFEIVLQQDENKKFKIFQVNKLKVDTAGY